MLGWSGSQNICGWAWRHHHGRALHTQALRPRWWKCATQIYRRNASALNSVAMNFHHIQITTWCLEPFEYCSCVKVILDGAHTLAAMGASIYAGTDDAADLKAQCGLTDIGLLVDGGSISFGSQTCSVVHTPGHSPGDQPAPFAALVCAALSPWLPGRLLHSRRNFLACFVPSVACVLSILMLLPAPILWRAQGLFASW